MNKVKTLARIVILSITMSLLFFQISCKKEPENTSVTQKLSPTASSVIPSKTLSSKPVKPEIAEYLILNGADMNAATDNGYTVLHSAVFAGNVEVAEYLISKGEDVNAKSGNGFSVLHAKTGKEKKLPII